MEQLWGQHLEAEFGTKDADAAVATMVDDACVTHVPVDTGGRGVSELAAFYRDDFIPSWPDDVEVRPINRVVGADQLVDEIHVSFTHAHQMDWFLPGIPATNREIDLDVVIVVQFRDGRIAAERVYWDQATVLRQIGLPPESASLASAGGEGR
jgi:carboxymethylenebutenolidase